MSKIMKIFRESIFIKKIKDSRNVMILSMIMACICVLITYPGIFYSDSYERVREAYEIKNLILNALRGERVRTEMWLTITPSYFMAACLEITGNIAGYTICQVFFFFYASFLLIKKLSKNFRIIQYIAFVINPLFYCVSVYYEAGIGCISSIVFLVLIVWERKTLDNVLDKIILVAGTIIFSFAAFGYRANAFTILPVIFLIIFLWNKRKKLRIILVSSVILGLVFIAAVPKWLCVDTMSSASASFVWEIVTTIQNMDWKKQAEYIDYLDNIGGDGATAYAVQVSNKDNICNCLSGGINWATVSVGENPKEILKKYIKLALKEPLVFFKTKKDFVCSTLGISAPLGVWEWTYNWADKMEEFGFSDTNQRHRFLDRYSNFMEQMEILRMPWLMFLVSFILLVLEKRINRMRERKIGLQEGVFLIAVFYYGAFMINNQSMEFRYFYPSCYLLVIMDVSLFISIMEILVKRYVKKKFLVDLNRLLLSKCDDSEMR